MKNSTSPQEENQTSKPKSNIYVYAEVNTLSKMNYKSDLTKVKAREVGDPYDPALFYVEGEFKNIKELILQLCEHILEADYFEFKIYFEVNPPTPKTFVNLEVHFKGSLKLGEEVPLRLSKIEPFSPQMTLIRKENFKK